MSRHGKIARLPSSIREELNRRLHESEATGATLVAWLNSLPEARASLQLHFDGKPISEQNLSEWRKRGYEDWLRQQEHRELTTRLCHEAATMAESEGLPPTAILDRLTVLHYAATAHEMRRVTQGKQRWQLMRQICTDYTRLRRNELAAERLEYQRTHSPEKSPTPNSPSGIPTPPTGVIETGANHDHRQVAPAAAHHGLSQTAPTTADHGPLQAAPPTAHHDHHRLAPTTAHRGAMNEGSRGIHAPVGDHRVTVAERRLPPLNRPISDYIRVNPTMAHSTLGT